MLVVALAYSGGVIEGAEQAFGGGVVGEAAPRAVALPEAFGRWIGGDDTLAAGEVIELNDFRAVGGIGEFEAEHFGILLRLLEAVVGVLVGGFGFDDGEGKIAAEEEDLVDALG
jgi:uncharacterized membrane protein YedE/YeeE